MNFDSTTLVDALCYESQSEADLALIEMLCFFTPDDEQVLRVFLASALGQREKARRRDYVPRSIRSARAMIASNRLPMLDFSGLKVTAQSTTSSPNKPSSPQRPGVITTRVSDVPPQEISWLWPSRIAEGKVTVIAGHPGLGKSQLIGLIFGLKPPTSVGKGFSRFFCADYDLSQRFAHAFSSSLSHRLDAEVPFQSAPR